MSEEQPASSPQDFDGADKSFIEPDAHSFVLKIWCEATTKVTGRRVWRGHITHVATGQRRYLTSMNELTLFIGSYLRAMHAKLPLLLRVQYWLRR